MLYNVKFIMRFISDRNIGRSYIIGVNVVVNENDMQIIADIFYNDVNIQLLFSGYGLFLALVNVFGFYLTMVSQDRSA